MAAPPQQFTILSTEGRKKRGNNSNNRTYKSVAIVATAILNNPPNKFGKNCFGGPGGKRRAGTLKSIDAFHLNLCLVITPRGTKNCCILCTVIMVFGHIFLAIFRTISIATRHNMRSHMPTPGMPPRSKKVSKAHFQQAVMIPSNRKSKA